MLPPDLPLILSPQAEDDFADILQYTLEAWGENQVYVYSAVFDKALQTIQQNPQIDHRKIELSKGGARRSLMERFQRRLTSGLEHLRFFMTIVGFLSAAQFF